MTSFAPTLPVVFVFVVVVIFVGRRSERHFTHNRCEQKRRDFCRSPFLPVRKSRKRKTTFTSGSRRRRRDAQHKEKGAALPSRRRRALLLLLLLLLLLFSNGARARASKFVSISISFHKKKNLSSTRDDDVSSLLIDQKEKEEEEECNDTNDTAPLHDFGSNGSSDSTSSGVHPTDKRIVGLSFPSVGIPPRGKAADDDDFDDTVPKMPADATTPSAT